MSEYDHIIGRASDLAPDLPHVEERKETIHPLVSLEELQSPSPQPFSGRPDPDYPELDSLDVLYIPRFLIRRWGPEKFERSPYFALWRSEAGRGERIADPKPERKK